jgi:hypothetical protein
VISLKARSANVDDVAAGADVGLSVLVIHGSGVRITTTITRVGIGGRFRHWYGLPRLRWRELPGRAGGTVTVAVVADRYEAVSEDVGESWWWARVGSGRELVMRGSG